MQTTLNFCSQKEEQRTQRNLDTVSANSSHLFVPYKTYDGPAWDDPRTATSTNVIADGLSRIIEIEGPMMAKRAYDIYLRNCGIKRMGRELKRLMNKALQNAIREGRVISEDEWKKRGLLHTIVRATGTSPIKLRHGGDRSFEELPPSEILIASHLAIKNASHHKGTDEHLHAILAMFGLKRLATPTGIKLLEILEMKFDYSEKWLREN